MKFHLNFQMVLLFIRVLVLVPLATELVLQKLVTYFGKQKNEMKMCNHKIAKELLPTTLHQPQQGRHTSRHLLAQS